ncbi:hypothetical protein CO657_13695 [Rhizobium acidisoli]|uniref:Uncharacterized protein n=1 Tax=Rhizobium acidisoli TaxID=1538158 RepID=A0AAE5WQ56_9HYPH|nr:hypothetical protein CO657_13695 [Rhizobium acidisoli]
MTSIVWGSQRAQPISPPVGEMPGRAEGGGHGTASPCWFHTGTFTFFSPHALALLFRRNSFTINRQKVHPGNDN